MNKNKKLGFTLAEVLIVIGIIGVVAALTLPNLNHATGDKETVTRLQKAYSILSEANDRAVAIYGPVSGWNAECRDNLKNCWVRRIGEFLKISKSCDEMLDENADCSLLSKGDMQYNEVIYQLSDGITFAATDSYSDCLSPQNWYYRNDICIEEIFVDINGPDKGKNQEGHDIFRFMLSDNIGFTAAMFPDGEYPNDNNVSECIFGGKDRECTWWVLEFGNLDYLKTDENGKCNNSNIILDGTTNTSCH